MHTKIFVATALLIAASSSFAKDDTRPAAEVQAEKTYIDTQFAKLDTNKDGKIDKTEFAAFMTTFLKQKRDEFDKSFDAADTNHDGKLSPSEAAKANPMLSKNFKAIDTNGDGFLTPVEIRAAINKQHPQ